MLHSKTITRPDGTRFRLKVKLLVTQYEHKWSHAAHPDTKYDQRKYTPRVYTATDTELLQAKEELWMKLKPETINKNN